VDVQVDAWLPVSEPLNQQRELLAMQPRPVEVVERCLREFLTGSAPPEGQLTVVVRGWHVNHGCKEPAEVRHVWTP
jgi:hypothetical protein